MPRSRIPQLLLVPLLGWLSAASALTPVTGAKAIASGFDHVCAIDSRDRATCWGNMRRENAFSEPPLRLIATDARGTTEFVALSAGLDFTCGITKAGAAMCWGWNSSGQLGDGTQLDRGTPAVVAGLGSGVTSVAAAGGRDGAHACAVTADGVLHCWGLNFDHQLGVDTPSYAQATPVVVTALGSSTKAVRAARSVTCAISDSGGLKCWGRNEVGMLGDGTRIDRPFPVDVVGLTSGVVDVAIGEIHACALTGAGAVKCWGTNYAGQLGDDSILSSDVAHDVPGLASGVVAIAAGDNHSCALMADGAVVCWGSNVDGALGDGTTVSRAQPLPVLGLGAAAIAIAAGDRHTCALLAGGTLRCWGIDDTGALGDGTYAALQSSPVGVAGLSSDVAAVTLGPNDSCARMADASFRCWGNNQTRQLGDAPSAMLPTPVPMTAFPDAVAKVALGNFFTCAVSTTGGVKCRGSNQYGQLGDGSTADRTTPVEVSGLASGVATVAAGSAGACALTDLGVVRCWGNNSRGQVGDGTLITRTAPKDVVGLSANVTAISGGSWHNCALTSAGGVKCWGAGGAVGDGTNLDRSTAVDVTGLATGVAAVSAGGNFTCALTTAGGVKCWGDNLFGQLGDGTQDTRLTPVNVTGLQGGVVAIAAGGSRACALTSAGSVKCWGDDQYQLPSKWGIALQPTPTVVAGLEANVTAIAAGGNHNCALLGDGGLQCWGANVSGQVGNGAQGYSARPVAVVTQPAPTLLGVVSRKTHGAAGTFELPLSTNAANPTTEPRTEAVAGSHTIAFVFDTDLEVRGSMSIRSGAGSIFMGTIVGNEFRLNLTGVTNAQYLQLDVGDLLAPPGGMSTAAGVRVGFLVGDVNGTRNVMLSDLLNVNASLSQSATAANFLRNVNASGTVSIADLLLVNANLTKALPAP